MKTMITILGPTACGKTTLATHLALALDAEIISADSRQVYRNMTIGTGKDLSDYEIDGHSIPYHLIDICEPGTKYNLYEYQRDFQEALHLIDEHNKIPILCGGTGLYLEAAIKGYHLSPVPQNPSLRSELEGKSLEELCEILKDLKAKTGTIMHNTTDVDSCQRAIRAIEIEQHNLHNPLPERQMPSVPSLVIGVDIDRELRRKRITQRLKQRLEEGMIDEVQSLLDKGILPEDLIYYGLEYKYITLFCTKQITYDEMFRQLEIAIHQFAKRQMTWFRGMERRGTKIYWLDSSMPINKKIDKITTLYDQYQMGVTL